MPSKKKDYTKTSNDKPLKSPYLTRIILENFRGYKDFTNVNFGRRITLFFGKGSVGKSTILDAISSLNESNKSQKEMEGLSPRHTLSKQNKNQNNKLKLGFYVKDTYERGIVKTFRINKDDTKLENITLYSPSEPDMTETDEDKFAEFSTSSVPKDIKGSRDYSNHYVCSVNFIENKFAFRELFEETFKNSEALIAKLKEVKAWVAEYQTMLKAKREYLKDCKDKKKNPDDQKLKDFDKRREELFARYKLDDYRVRFSPFRFIFKSKNSVDNHIKFLEKKRSYDEFLKYIGDDVRFSKKFLFKNFRSENIQDQDFMYNQSSSKTVEQISNFDSFSDFLCYTLTLLLNDTETIYPTKHTFIYNPNRDGKVLSGQAMLDMCCDSFVPVIQKIISCRKLDPTGRLPSLMGRNLITHELIERNLAKINRWLKTFEYDFTISVDRAGVGDVTEINHKKFGQKLPSSQGGSGVDYLLTFLPSCVAEQDKTILIEEPEKSLHARMQVNLAELFVEASEDNQLIIETHSENLLLGLLKLVREKKIDVQDIKVNYIYMDDNGISKIDPLTVNKRGGFDTKWRHGFFTEKLDLL